MIWWLWIGCAERPPLSITSTWGTRTSEGLPLTINVRANRAVCVEDQRVRLRPNEVNYKGGVTVASIATRPYTGISNIDHTIRIRLGYYADPPYVSRVQVGRAAFRVRCLQPGEGFQRSMVVHWPLSEYETHPALPLRCVPSPSYRIEIPWSSPPAPVGLRFRTPAGEPYRAYVFDAMNIPQRFVISDPLPLPPDLIVAQGPPCGTSYWRDAETWPTSADQIGSRRTKTRK